eukprot:Opistho-2@31485
MAHADRCADLQATASEGASGPVVRCIVAVYVRRADFAHVRPAYKTETLEWSVEGAAPHAARLLLLRPAGCDGSCQPVAEGEVDTHDADVDGERCNAYMRAISRVCDRLQTIEGDAFHSLRRQAIETRVVPVWECVHLQ